MGAVGGGGGRGGGHIVEIGMSGLVLQDGADGGKGTNFGSMLSKLSMWDLNSNNFLWIVIAWLEE